MASSLYGGIAFKNKDAAPPVLPAAATPDASSSTSLSQSLSPAPVPAATDPEKDPKANWSSSLRFAPIARKRPAAVQSAFKSAFASAEDVSLRQGPRIVGPSKPSLVVASQAPSTPLPSTSLPPRFTPVAVATTSTLPPRSVMKPPPMTLDEDDVNGFQQTAAGKRAANKKGRGGKKGGMGIKRDESAQFGDGKYDPTRPCDYSAYKTYVQNQRTQRRLEREEERRGDRSSGSGSDGSSDGGRSDEEAPTNKKARLFAPPTSYNSPPRASNEPSYTPAAPQEVIAAYAPRAETGDEAYARRAAMSSAKPFVPAAPIPSTSFPSFSPATTMSSGPVVYPSASHPPPPPPPSSFHAPPTFSPSTFSSSPSSYPPPPPPGFLPPPQFGAPPPSFDTAPPRPPPNFEPVGSVPHPGLSPTLPIAVSEAAARARDIAQRLGKLGALQPPPAAAAPIPPPAEDLPYDDRPFAERMMSKFGWEAGKGLGADESGMTAALRVSRAHAPSSKKGKGKSNEGDVPVPTGMAAGAKGRNTIVDSGRQGRVADQAERMGGEPSRVVLLTNLCGINDVDDDLGGEVAEEANKFGVVERCFVYLVPGETRDEESVRIFLVMSGLAGGYNAVRNFDGRFFSGRTVKARFYDERSFNAGEHRL